MVRAIRGTLIETEPSIKEVILSIGEAESFIIEDIDDCSVFVKRSSAPGLRQRVARMMSFGAPRE